MDGSLTLAKEQSPYVVFDIANGTIATVRDDRLIDFSERHHFRPAEEPALQSGATLGHTLSRQDVKGILFVVHSGIPGNAVINAVKRALRLNRPAFIYWPHEEAIEVADPERLWTFRRLWIAQRLYTRWITWKARRQARLSGRATASEATEVRRAYADELSAQLTTLSGEVSSIRAHVEGGVSWLNSTGLGLAAQAKAHFAQVADAPGAAGLAQTLDQIDEHLKGVAAHFAGGLTALDRMTEQSATARGMLGGLDSSPRLSQAEAVAAACAVEAAAAPKPFRLGALKHERDGKMPGVGAYVRLDFWAPLITGGSYGHTVYQCRALSKTCDDFVAIVANRFATLDRLGVRQEVIKAQRTEGNEQNLIDANRFYYDALRLTLGALRPAFVFERLVPASYVCAKICQELGIPYIAEYNGSELSMMKSFQGKTSPLEDLYIAAENAAFAQASVISVVSENVAEDLIARGVPRTKILVNPNAVDLEAYQPATPSEAAALRSELGFSASDRVIGFIGTFGGWHGLDVMAAAMPKIAEANPAAKFLMIGDGTHKHLITETVAKHKLESRVVDKGRVPQAEGARLLKACDILVSPHSTHMVDSKFFGSPTKLFEYMAMGVGIVASDLEQIGAVLRPAISPPHADASACQARAVLCRPGDVDSFVEGVNLLVRDGELSRALGANAREAARTYYSWDQHVADLWAFASGRPLGGLNADLKAKSSNSAV